MSLKIKNKLPNFNQNVTKLNDNIYEYPDAVVMSRINYQS